jgi:glycine cleavage system H protein
MMGKFAARVPTDRRYSKNHMWAQSVEKQPVAGDKDSTTRATSLLRFGFSAYAVRLLQDVYFLDWTVDAGTDLRERQEIGSIESSKAESSLYAPIAGRLVEFNQTLLGDPSMINVDLYDRGWLFTIAGSGESLLSPAEYLLHLEAAWKIAERTIKGQMNE